MLPSDFTPSIRPIHLLSFLFSSALRVNVLGALELHTKSNHHICSRPYYLLMLSSLSQYAFAILLIPLVHVGSPSLCLTNGRYSILCQTKYLIFSAHRSTTDPFDLDFSSLLFYPSFVAVSFWGLLSVPSLVGEHRRDIIFPAVVNAVLYTVPVSFKSDSLILEILVYCSSY